MNDIIYLANNTTVGENSAQTGGQQVQTSTAAPAPASEPQQSSSPTSWLFNPNSQLLLTMVAVFAIMYFFTIRPQRKREKQLREIQNSIKAGDWVVTFSGMFGKVVDVGTDILMVEFGTNKGVRIPVRKAELTKTSEPVLVPKKEEPEEKTDKKAEKDA